MSTIQTNYQALVIEENEIPHESVIFHAASEGGKPHWNHIGDLDTFFKNVYEFHQKHGFKCIILEGVKNILIPFLIYFGVVYIINGIIFNFDEHPSLMNKTDIGLKDIFLSPSEAIQNFGIVSWLITIVGTFSVLFRCYKLWQTYSTYDDIKQFFTSAMKIEKSQVIHLTWHEVQCRLREVQHEQQMCVHKSDLTELDISHRILRHTNYLVAMINKNILPIKHKVPIIGHWIFMTTAFKYVLFILFFSKFSLVFKETGKLREEYKRFNRRKEAAEKLEKAIKILTAISAFLCPFIFGYSLLSLFLKYAADLKYSPNRLSSRQWSQYARYYLRHFNELDHELEARLARAYKPANEYVKSFSSPVTVIIARTASRIFGAAAVFFFLWGVFKERLFTIPGALMIITGSSVIYLVSIVLIPEENIVYFPKHLMKKIIAEIHYVPDHFKDNAQLPTVRDEFCELFQYKFVSILDETFSALLLPLILYFKLLPRALDIVDFFRNFTVEVSGVGDVCSFALMDVSRHGNNQWYNGVHTKVDHQQQAEGGKTELSLIHFRLMNPDWEPPPSSDVFINEMRQRVMLAQQEQDIQDPYYTSLNSLSTFGSRYASLVNSIHMSHHRQPANCRFPNALTETNAMSGGIRLAEGPPYVTQGGFLSSWHGDLGGPETMQADPSGLNPLEMRVADMNFSALYLHDVHKKLVECPLSQVVVHQQPPAQEPENNDTESSPLVPVTNYVQ